jgi:hypothetical protein
MSPTGPAVSGWRERRWPAQRPDCPPVRRRSAGDERRGGRLPDRRPRVPRHVVTGQPHPIARVVQGHRGQGAARTRGLLDLRAAKQGVVALGIRGEQRLDGELHEANRQVSHALGQVLRRIVEVGHEDPDGQVVVEELAELVRSRRRRPASGQPFPRVVLRRPHVAACRQKPAWTGAGRQHRRARRRTSLARDCAAVGAAGSG